MPDGNARANDTVFCLSWVWRRGMEGRAFSEHARRSDLQRIGQVTLTLPVVVFRGNETCTKVQDLCTTAFLDLCS